MADAHDLRSCAARRVGSSPTPGTKTKTAINRGFYFLIYCCKVRADSLKLQKEIRGEKSLSLGSNRFY